MKSFSLSAFSRVQYFAVSAVVAAGIGAAYITTRDVSTTKPITTPIVQPVATPEKKTTPAASTETTNVDQPVVSTPAPALATAQTSSTQVSTAVVQPAVATPAAPAPEVPAEESLVTEAPVEETPTENTGFEEVPMVDGNYVLTVETGTAYELRVRAADGQPVMWYPFIGQFMFSDGTTAYAKFGGPIYMIMDNPETQSPSASTNMVLVIEEDALEDYSVRWTIDHNGYYMIAVVGVDPTTGIATEYDLHLTVVPGSIAAPVELF